VPLPSALSQNDDRRAARRRAILVDEAAADPHGTDVRREKVARHEGTPERSRRFAD
jgi:hypothetical protein